MLDSNLNRMDKATKSLLAETCLCKAKLREGIAALKVLLASALFTAEADTIIQLFRDGWDSLQANNQLLRLNYREENFVKAYSEYSLVLKIVPWFLRLFLGS